MSEVAKFNDVSQFWPGKTEFACGFYAAGTVKFAGKDTPSGTSYDIEAWADDEYFKKYGEDTAFDTGGVFLPDEQQLILNAGLHYQTINAIDANSSQTSDIQEIKASLHDGYPVIACITYRSGNFFGPPLGKEYDDFSWSGNAIKTQQFSRKRCQWENGKANWY